ncbi:hypothetical protein PTSG_08813 [Salpingoeca rosetta]|uniref:Uncharacterized protein n=1 Tax=Salpingoeca rosetta (strain ATCC 50818 / BSB-021) TaxID=946362 RepID=F2UKS3_SALR5|nr:uncharacterized protein PTSG_08813 [Salpingoeca rosetta]EGD77722.1 hypothetical protein PTSG_08813 [Salpingoeca rosetta]|eukprot:XP_004990198.1 hypothetical protein PTSG_08813 [Salpingoeca rosetta]
MGDLEGLMLVEKEPRAGDAITLWWPKLVAGSDPLENAYLSFRRTKAQETREEFIKQFPLVLPPKISEDDKGSKQHNREEAFGDIFAGSLGTKARALAYMLSPVGAPRQTGTDGPQLSVALFDVIAGRSFGRTCGLLDIFQRIFDSITKDGHCNIALPHVNFEFVLDEEHLPSSFKPPPAIAVGNEAVSRHHTLVFSTVTHTFGYQTH